MGSGMYLLYRYNSFFKKVPGETLLRVGSQEMSIKENLFSYESIVEMIDKLQRPTPVEELNGLGEKQVALLRFLIKAKCVALSKVEHEESNTFKYLLRNYKDFNAIQNQLSRIQMEMVIPRKGTKDREFIQDITNVFNDKRDFYLDYPCSEEKEKRVLLLVITSVQDVQEVLDDAIYEDYERVILFTTFLEENYISNVKSAKVMNQLLHKILECGINKREASPDKKLLTFMMNYVFILLMDQCAQVQRLQNTFIFNMNYETKNNSFYGLALEKEAFSIPILNAIELTPKKDKKFSINEFIKISKNLLDLSFNYKFSKDGYLNVVTTEVKFGEKCVKVGYKNESLLEAAEESIRSALKEIFLIEGLNVKPLIGLEETENYIKTMEAFGKSADDIKAFQDFQTFSGAGILFVEVSK